MPIPPYPLQIILSLPADDTHQLLQVLFSQMLSLGLMTALFFALIGMIYGRTHLVMSD